MEKRKLRIWEMNRLSPEDYAAVSKTPLTVVLDDVRSLHNVGSVFRTADAFRVERIILCGITATPPQPEIHKTALGAEFTVAWSYSKLATDAVVSLKGEGYTVWAVEQTEGSTMIDQLRIDPHSRHAIVLGHEVHGVRQEVIDLCDGCIEIPQYGTKHSLNVSVAAGIVVWEMAKQITNNKE